MRESTSYMRPYICICIYICIYTHTLVVCMYCIFFDFRSANMLWLMTYFDMILTTNQRSIFCITTFLRWKLRGFGPMWWSHVSCTSSPSLPRVWLVRQMPSKMMRMHRSAFRLRGIGLNAWTLSQHHSWVGEIWGSPLEFGRSLRWGKVWRFTCTSITESNASKDMFWRVFVTLSFMRGVSIGERLACSHHWSAGRRVALAGDDGRFRRY